MNDDITKLLRESSTSESPKSICKVCNTPISDKETVCSNCGERVSSITLATLGKRLPIGIIESSPNGEQKLLKDFNIARLDWNKEKEISTAWKTMSANSSTVVLDYILCVLAHTVTDIGGMDFKKHDIDKRMYILGQMFAGDVFYMYAYLRVYSIGPEFSLTDIKCPICNRVNKRYDVDLSSIEVLTHDSVDEITLNLELRHGFKLVGETRKKITLQPISFRVMASNDIDDEALFFAEVLKSSCVEIEGVEGGLITDEEISQMSPYDLALIRSENDWLAGGIDWSVDIVCPNQTCGHKFTRVIDWRFGNFFSLSSQSLTRRRRTKR
jgi:hypothetical protein